MTAKLWGDHIAGPILAIIAIASVVGAAFVRNDPSLAAKLVVWSAWLTSIAAVFLMFVAQYDTWKKSDDELQDEIKKHAGSDLRGQIRFGYVDKSRLIPSTGWEKIPQGCLVTLYVDVVNHNPQIAYPRADLSTIQIKLNGVVHEGAWHHVVSGLEVNDDRLAIKTLIDWFDGLFQGLPESIPKLGYVQSLIPSLSSDLLFGRDELIVGAVVTIVDTLGKKHTISNENIALAIDKLRGVTYLTVRKDV